jgi:hypothetical protein
MDFHIKIKEDDVDRFVATISASLTPGVMDSMLKHIQASGQFPSEEIIEGFRANAFVQWVEMFTFLKKNLDLHD